MALTENDITAKNFKKFFTALSPYLGSYDKGKLTFVGEVKAFFAETAPNGFLVCDGATYDKADYPQLANLLLSLTDHSAYEVSGDDTKFKVPDLRGEFLRGTGTNSHANQGSGAGVGVHQDGTLLPAVNTDGSRIYSSKPGIMSTTNNADSLIGDDTWGSSPSNGTSGVNSGYSLFTSRPTNTSVLYCIAYKDTMVDIDFLSYGGERFAKSDMYDTNERVIGKWIDGKPLYQKTYMLTGLTQSSNTIAHGLTNLDTIVYCFGVIRNSTDGKICPLDHADNYGNQFNVYLNVTKTNIIIDAHGYTNYPYDAGNVTLIYTKTTDTADSFKYSTPTDYSTEEKIVGTWIDGKPLWQKTIDLGQDTQISTTEWTSIGLSLNTFGVITSAIGNTSTDFRYCPILCARISDELKVKIIRSDGGQYMAIRYITLQYTKTTDA